MALCSSSPSASRDRPPWRPALSTTVEEAPGRSVARVAAQAVGVSKVYGSGDARVGALDDVAVTFTAGQFAAIMGPSGSGKSTLMHCLAGLDTPTAGQALIGDTDITALK